MDLDAICADILKHYHAVDSATSAFGKRAGLSCPPGCGQCCETPDIQATELEMLPMARSITQTGKTETLGDLSRGTCVFFEPGPGPGAGALQCIRAAAACLQTLWICRPPQQVWPC